MAIIVFQHSDKGGPGRLGATLRDNGFRLDIRRPDLGGVKGVPSDLDNVEGVLILGGPQNVTDIEKYVWMQAEVAFIKSAHAAELPVIGICLGGQLIAHALGGKVTPREKPAIGFYPVSVTVPGQTETIMSGIPWEHPQVFSCGQQVKDLPPGAMLLAGTKATPVQAFKVGLRTYGFLYHFECDRSGVDELMRECKRGMEVCGTTPGEVHVQADQQYATFARVSDRLCVNLATYCFPLMRRLSA
jgi:GMP synthase-like glutamine amidotransferase